MLVWMAHGGVAGDTKLGNPLKPPQGGTSSQGCSQSQDGGMAAEEGSWEQGAGIWWICFHPCPRCGTEPWTPPGVMQLLGIKTLTSGTLIGSRKVLQGCCGRILRHQVPLPRTGIHLGKGKVPPHPSSPQKPPMVCENGCQHVWDTQGVLFHFSPASEVCLDVSQGQQ